MRTTVILLMLGLLCSTIMAGELIKDVDKFIIDNKGDWEKWKKNWDDRIKDLEKSDNFLGEENYACDSLKNWLVDLKYDSELQKDKKLELAYWYKLYTTKKWKIPETISQSIVEQFIRKTLGINEEKKEEPKEEVSIEKFVVEQDKPIEQTKTININNVPTNTKPK